MKQIYQPYHSFSRTIATICIFFFPYMLFSKKDALPGVQRIKLTNIALRFIDGVPFGVDAQAIKDILIIRKKIRTIQFGVFDKNKNVYIGRYALHGKNYCLKELVALEKQHKKEFEHKKELLYNKHINLDTFNHDWILLEEKLEESLEKKLQEQEAISVRRHSNEEQQLLEAKKLKRKLKREYAVKVQEEREKLEREHMKDIALYDAELKKHHLVYTKQMSSVKQILAAVKKEIMDITGPFLEQARSAKEFLLPLMEEWAEKVNRPFSPILRWHEEESGTEIEMFNKDINSFVRIDMFCTDLVDFNESIVYSCPKGYKQFMNLLGHKKQKPL